MDDKNRTLAMAVRAALLALVDALEIWLDIERTRDIRAEWKKMTS
jgi:hypothetical protein